MLEKKLLKLCEKASRKKEVPVAALIVDSSNKIISKAYNRREKSNLTLDHAEIRCLIKANKCMKNKFLNDCTMYVTLEPCDMCKILLKESRIKTVKYIIERNPQKKMYSKTKFENWDCDVFVKNQYKNILSSFFKKRR